MKNLFLALLATFTFSLSQVSIANDANGDGGTEQGEEKKKDSADC